MPLIGAAEKENRKREETSEEKFKTSARKIS